MIDAVLVYCFIFTSAAALTTETLLYFMMSIILKLIQMTTGTNTHTWFELGLQIGGMEILKMGVLVGIEIIHSNIAHIYPAVL